MMFRFFKTKLNYFLTHKKCPYHKRNTLKSAHSEQLYFLSLFTGLYWWPKAGSFIILFFRSDNAGPKHNMSNKTLSVHFEQHQFCSTFYRPSSMAKGPQCFILVFLTHKEYLHHRMSENK